MTLNEIFLQGHRKWKFVQTTEKIHSKKKKRRKYMIHKQNLKITKLRREKIKIQHIFF